MHLLHNLVVKKSDYFQNQTGHSVTPLRGSLWNREKFAHVKSYCTFWCVVISDVLELQYENNCQIITVLCYMPHSCRKSRGLRGNHEIFRVSSLYLMNRHLRIQLGRNTSSLVRNKCTSKFHELFTFRSQTRSRTKSPPTKMISRLWIWNHIIIIISIFRKLIKIKGCIRLRTNDDILWLTGMYPQIYHFMMILIGFSREIPEQQGWIACGRRSARGRSQFFAAIKMLKNAVR